MHGHAADAETLGQFIDLRRGFLQKIVQDALTPPIDLGLNNDR